MGSRRPQAGRWRLCAALVVALAAAASGCVHALFIPGPVMPHSGADDRSGAAPDRIEGKASPSASRLSLASECVAAYVPAYVPECIPRSSLLAGFYGAPPPSARAPASSGSLVTVRRVQSREADAALFGGADLAKGEGWAVDLGDSQFHGNVTVTNHDVLPGPGRAQITSVRVGARKMSMRAPTGPFAFAGVGFSMEWVSPNTLPALQPLLLDDGGEPFPLGAYMEAGAGFRAGEVVFVAQLTASASLLHEEPAVPGDPARDVSLTTWGFSFGAGVTF